MSIETMSWAKLQRCGCPYAKAVLLELANWSRADGICEFRKVSDIAFVIEVSERTVQRALKLLEDHKADGGLDLIRRVSRSRKDGGQQANCFELVGYIYPGDCQAPPGVHQSPPGCPVDGGGGDHAVTPNRELESNLKESPQNPPGARQARRTISEDWVAPTETALPAAAGSLASQWPDGAYRAEAEAFHNHWRGTGQRRADWNALWASRVQARHCDIMRAAKAGVRFTAPASAAASTPGLNSAPSPVIAQQNEDARSARLRQALRGKVSDAVWNGAFASAAFLFDEPGLKVIVRNEPEREQMETNFAAAIRKAARSIDPNLRWVSVSVEARQASYGRRAA